MTRFIDQAHDLTGKIVYNNFILYQNCTFKKIILFKLVNSINCTLHKFVHFFQFLTRAIVSFAFKNNRNNYERSFDFKFALRNIAISSECNDRAQLTAQQLKAGSFFLLHLASFQTFLTFPVPALPQQTPSPFRTDPDIVDPAPKRIEHSSPPPPAPPEDWFNEFLMAKPRPINSVVVVHTWGYPFDVPPPPHSDPLLREAEVWWEELADILPIESLSERRSSSLLKEWPKPWLPPPTLPLPPLPRPWLRCSS